jgi:glyoxylase-like metal-dependent hydrolase (beta-lactamase superfamily II)
MVGISLRNVLILVLFLALSSSSYADPFAYTFQEVSPGIWVGIRDNSTQFPVMGTTTFVVGGEGVIVFDGGGVALMSERALAKIREVTDLPVTHIVISHWHGDHNLGIHRLLDAFPGAQVIGHAFTRAAMLGAPMDYVVDFRESTPRYRDENLERLASGVTRSGDPLSEGMRANLQTFVDHADTIHAEYGRFRVTPPTLTFDERLVIHSGDRVIELRHLGHGNTEGDIVMWLPEERVVATGDLVVVPFPYGFNVPPRAWAETLQRLQALNYATLIPGHGDVQTDAGYVDLLIETAESIADQRDALLTEGLSQEETEAALDFSRFEERFTGGDDYLTNRFQAWFARPFRKAALEALTGEPMVRLEREPAVEKESGSEP